MSRLSELAVRSLGSNGEGMEAVELAIRTAMTRLGASLLGQLLATDTGHRGPRIDCGAGHLGEFVSYRTRTIDTVLGPVELRRAYYHCATCRRGENAPRDDQLGVTGVSLSPGLRKMTARPPPRPSRSPRPARPAGRSGRNPVAGQAYRTIR